MLCIILSQVACGQELYWMNVMFTGHSWADYNTEYQNNLRTWLAESSVCAKSLQLCPNLCSPVDSSLPGSPVPGILQARTLEWVAISFSIAWKWKVKVKSLSRVRL